MKLAFYRSSAPGATLLDRTIDRLTGGGGFSHVELVFDSGWAFSSSGRDGGTRFKWINFADPATWEMVNVGADACDVMQRCCEQANKLYDWIGVFGFVLPVRSLDHPGRRWFCSEVCAWALGWDSLEQAQLTSPNQLWSQANDRQQLPRVSGTASSPHP